MMRRTVLILLAVCSGACTGPEAPDKPSDGSLDTEVSSETDVTLDSDGPGVPVFDTVVPLVRPVRSTVGGGDVASYHHDDPTGIVFLFHGTGGSTDIVDGLEVVIQLNALVEAGFSFLAMESDNRDRRQYDVSSSRDANPDFQRLMLVRSELIAAGKLTEQTPIYTWGFSQGGSFATYAAHAGLEEGWPVAGVASHNARGRGGRYGGPAATNYAFMPGVNDEVVGLSGVQEDYEDHLGTDFDSLWLPADEQPLYPTRIAQYDYIDASTSRALVREAVDLGYFDDDGMRTFGTDNMERTLNELIDLLEPRYPKPVKAQMKVCLGMHAINSLHAQAMVDAFVAWGE